MHRTSKRQLPMLYAGHDAGPRPVTREQVCAAVERGVDPVVVAAHVAQGASDMWTECLTVLAEGDKPACARGCAFCCHQRVEVTAPEAFLVARTLVSASAQQLMRLRAAAARHATLSAREQFLQQCPCPFLDERGGCSIYEVRPIACRRAHSLDADVCRGLAEQPTLDLRVPVSDGLDWNTSALVLGYYEGLAHAAVPPHQYELANAVALALDVEDAEARWRRGEDVLMPALTRDAATLAVVLGQPA
jgi:uncharacterized protein